MGARTVKAYPVVSTNTSGFNLQVHGSSERYAERGGGDGVGFYNSTCRCACATF